MRIRARPDKARATGIEQEDKGTMKNRNRTKRTAALLLALAMLAAMLSGCGSGFSFGKAKDPTAKELMDGASGMAQYMDMQLDMTASGVQDGTEASMDMAMGVETDGEVSHIYDGSVSIGASGFNMTVQLEGWTDAKSGESYMNMSMLGQSSGWMKSDGGSIDTEALTDMAGTGWLETDEDAYALREHKKGEDWVVTWTVSGDALDKMLEGAADTGLELDADAGFKGELLVEAHFDEESHELKSVAVGGNADGMEISMTIAVRSTGEKSLEIPAGVIEEAAANEAGYDDGFTYGNDDEDWYGSGEPAIVSDGDGSDAYMDAFAQSVLDAGYLNGNIRVYHYSYETEVSWEWQSYDGDVMIGAEASHILDGSLGDARSEFLSDAEFTEGWLDCDGAWKGSTEDGWVAYYSDRDYVREMDYLKVYPDESLVLGVDVYSYEEGATAEDLWSELQAFLGAHGL